MKILNLSDIPYASDYPALAGAVHKDKSTLFRAVKCGKLRAHKTPDGKTIFLRKDVLKWLGIPEPEEESAKPLHAVKRREAPRRGTSKKPARLGETPIKRSRPVVNWPARL
jgi:hypothetical protein